VALLYETGIELHPLAVAKLFNVEEQLGLVILDKKTINDDDYQTGQTLAALEAVKAVRWAAERSSKQS